MDSKVVDIISSFKPISLEEMDSVKLLNRTDTKYVFEASKLPAILQDIKQSYAVLHIQNNPYQDYKTIYFDTFDDDMYLSHQNGKLNRYKIRHRTYLSTNAEYLEIKFKTNKGRTFKKRMQFPISKSLVEANEFIQKHSPFSGEQLRYKSLVEYTRLTLVDLVRGERATVDINLQVTNCENNERVDFSHICIIELKRDKSSNNSAMQSTLRKHRVFQRGMSKYTIGTAAIYNDIKKNRLKKKLRFLEKLKVTL
ncbi:MAG TPA: polyphosphate polymerase domain-containing protein [Bacteroidales bacterium]|nr:polyphosphate polymerase domain-containing protein [Bacteroidales bacterium]